MFKGVDISIAEVKKSKNMEKVLADTAGTFDYALYVGIPASKSSRNDSINNAELAFIQSEGVFKSGYQTAQQYVSGLPDAQKAQLYETGSPLYRIPPRPFIEPSLQRHRDDIERALRKAAEAGLEQGQNVLVQHLARLGMRCQNWVRGWFTNPENKWPPNAPSTIKAKGSSRPLIDTGELRKSITYVIRKGGRDID